MGKGSVTGPYWQIAGTPSYDYRANSLDAIDVIVCLFPYLCSRKREQARIAVERWIVSLLEPRKRQYHESWRRNTLLQVYQKWENIT